MKIYYVYILTNKFRGTLYIGVTSDLQRRIKEHEAKCVDGFTKKYGLSRLIYVESFDYVLDALNFEKRLKRWHREWKINLIEKNNPKWNNLYEKYFGIDPETSSG
jgi:putative endonuclease